MVVVRLGQRDGISRRHSARNDAHLVHAVAVLHQLCDDCVSAFMICGYSLIRFSHYATALCGTRHNLVHRLADILHRDELAVLARGEYSRLVENILDIRARKARGEPRKALEVDVCF